MFFIKQYKRWWNKNGIYLIIYGSLFLFIILLIIYFLNKNKIDNEVNDFDESIFNKKRKRKSSYGTRKVSSNRKVTYINNTGNVPDTGNEKKVFESSKGELICKQVVEKILNKPFIKIRLDSFKNNVTKRNLELDLYNEELKLGVEYSGRQHYEFVPHFHKNYEAFLNQQYRDYMKEIKCKENGIRLIIVPYTIKHEDIESYLSKELNKLNLISN
jgi:hypothetical protein